MYCGISLVFALWVCSAREPGCLGPNQIPLLGSCDRAGHLEGLAESSESGLYPLAMREQFSEKPPQCLLSGFQRGPWINLSGSLAWVF